MCPEYQVGEEGTRSRGRSGCRWTLGLGRAEITVGGGGLLCPASEQSQGSRWTVLRGPSLAWALARRCRGRSGIPSPSATQQPNERRLWGAEAERGTLISSLTGSCSMMDGRRQKDVHYYGAVSEDCTLISMTGNCTLMGDVVNP